MNNTHPGYQLRSGVRRTRRLYYGWVVVGALALTVTVSYGVLMYAFPVVLAAMQQELGWPQQTITGAYSAGALVCGIAAVPVGRCVDRYGPRAVMTLSATLASLLVAAWSQVRSPLSLYGVWIGLGACMAGLFYEPAFATVAQWFNRHRSRALAIITVAGGLASTIFVPLTASLMAHAGWRNAILVLAGIISILTILPHAIVLRRSPLDLGLSIDGEERSEPSCASRRVPQFFSTRAVLRSSSFRWIVPAFCLSAAVNMAFAVHLIPLLLERGHLIATASLALASMGVVKLAGRLLFVPLARHVTTATAIAVILTLQAAGLLLLLGGSARIALWISVLLFGMGDGATTPARAEIVAEVYGPSSYGAISGVIAMFLAGARAIGPVGASLVYAASGGYQVTVWIMVVFLVAGAGSVVSSATAARRIAPSG
jgi:MFS family permease